MLTINPIKNITIDSRQPWLYLRRLSGIHEVITFEINSSVTDVSGYVEIAVRTFKNDVYMGDLIGAYERTYRLGNGATYAYELKNTTGLTCEIWVRFVSRVFYVHNIDIDITNIEIIETIENTGDEMISILRLDNNWEFSCLGTSFQAYLRSSNGGEPAIGSCEFGYYTPSPEHTRLFLALGGGVAMNQTMKTVEFLSESNNVLAAYDFTNLGHKTPINSTHSEHGYSLPLHTSKERFKVRLTDNDTGGFWAWFSVSPSLCLLSI